MAACLRLVHPSPMQDEGSHRAGSQLTIGVGDAAVFHLLGHFLNGHASQDGARPEPGVPSGWQGLKHWGHRSLPSQAPEQPGL